MDLTLQHFAKEVGGIDDGPVTCAGGRTSWTVGGPVDPATRVVAAPEGIVEYEPAEMVVRVRAGTTVAVLDAALAAGGQQVALDPIDRSRATVGGVLAVGHSGLRRLRYGPVRDTLLEVTAVMADGRLVKAGGPVVKNVSGFDLARLLVGSLGTIGFLGEVVLRCSPLPKVARWLRADAAVAADPFEVRSRLFRPSSILWDGVSVWVLLEGSATDVDAEAGALGPGWIEVEGPPSLPSGPRVSMRPAALRALTGDFVAEIGVGTAHVAAPPPQTDPLPAPPTSGVPDASAAALNERVKAAFDPTGRMNPGRRP